MARRRRITINWPERVIELSKLRFYTHDRPATPGKTSLCLNLEGWDDTPPVTRIVHPKILGNGSWVSRTNRVASRMVILEVEVFNDVVDLRELRKAFGTMILSDDVRIRVLDMDTGDEEYCNRGFIEESIEWEEIGDRARITIPVTFANPEIKSDGSNERRL